MLVIGIAGQFCSGKSTVAKLFSEYYKAIVINADKIGHTVLFDKKVKKRLLGYFGKGIFKKNTVNRKALAEAAFASPKNHKALCRITHPLLVEKIKSKLQKIKSENPGRVIIIDAAVLIELELLKCIDRLIVVRINCAEQILRAKNKWGLSEKNIQRRIKLQIPLSRLVKEADFIIDNTGSMEDLKNQVKVWGNINGK